MHVSLAKNREICADGAIAIKLQCELSAPAFVDYLKQNSINDDTGLRSPSYIGKLNGMLAQAAGQLTLLHHLRLEWKVAGDLANACA